MLDLTKIRGSHTYKAGATFAQEMWSDRNTRGAQGIYDFSNAQTGNPLFQGTTLTSGTSVGMNYASFLLGMTSGAQRKRRPGSAMAQEYLGAVRRGQLEGDA